MSNLPRPLIAISTDGLPLGPAADTFTLSGTPCPGLCELTACDAPQEWDIRQGYGLSWATTVPKGEGLSKPVFTVKIWDGLQQDPAWVDFCSQFLSRPAPATPGTVQPKSFGFFHPVASRPPHNVTAVVVLDCKFQGHDGFGMLTWEISFLEWKQPLPAPPKPNQATPAAPNGPPAAEDGLGQATLNSLADLSAAEKAFGEAGNAQAMMSGGLESYSSIPGGS